MSSRQITLFLKSTEKEKILCLKHLNNFGPVFSNQVLKIWGRVTTAGTFAAILLGGRVLDQSVCVLS